MKTRLSGAKLVKPAANKAGRERSGLIKKTSRNVLRQGKHSRVRRKIAGTGDIPRLCVYKSLNHIYAQVIDDEQGKTLAAASTRDKELGDLASKTSTEAAKAVGNNIAVRAKAKGIDKVVFDRSGYKYHGRIAARESGLEF